MKSTVPSYRGLLLILILIAGTTVAAQDSVTAKFLDSLKMPPPAATDTVAATTQAVVDSAAVDTEAGYDSTADEMPVDTAIVGHLKKINADTLSLLKKDKGFYYQHWLDSLLRAEDAKVKIEKKPPNWDLSFLDGFFKILTVVLWMLVAAVVIFVVYKLFLGKNRLFLNSKKNIDIAVEEEEIITVGKYEGLIKKAESENNYRMAVRYQHLRTLQLLSDKNHVRPGTEKTNYQYVTELRKARPALAPDFADLTYKYEYVWYGEYMINGTMYDALRNSFTAFNQQIQ